MIDIHTYIQTDTTYSYNIDINIYIYKCTVEAALIHEAPTITYNTASASIAGNDLVAPVICRSTRLNWKKLAESVPKLNKRAIHKYRRHLFGYAVHRAPHLRSQESLTPIARRTRFTRALPTS